MEQRIAPIHQTAIADAMKFIVQFSERTGIAIPDLRDMARPKLKAFTSEITGAMTTAANRMNLMARRPEVQKNIMTEQELAELQRRLSLLSPFHVQEEYRVQIERCKLQSEVPPPYVI
jgi:hypothetical protein